MKLKFLFLTILLMVTFTSPAQDVTGDFENFYNKKTPLTTLELEFLRRHDFYLAPGILSETFSKDYFSSQKRILRKLDIPVIRLSTSSFSVEDSRLIIRDAIMKSYNAGRKSFFITHSLGGLALLEELLSDEDYSSIGGIIFIQSPFYGAPVADVYLDNPYHVQRWLGPILPFFNTSEETLQFLSTRVRKQFMENEGPRIRKLLVEIPVLTIAGEANGFRSLFKPSIDLIKYGCIKRAFGRCLTSVLFNGPYDQSDGMVPLESAKLFDSLHVTLKGVDHGETVVNIPFQNYDRERMTIALLKLFLRNNQSSATSVSEISPGPLE